MHPSSDHGVRQSTLLETHWASPESSAHDLAHWIARQLHQAIDRQGRALLSVSGGKSPVPLFHALSEMALPWDRVTVTLVDERQVDESHAASNARLVREHLLRGAARSARFVSLVGPQGLSSKPDWAQRVADADRRLRELGPADVMVLGMGLDGHTASLFTNAKGWALATDLQQSRCCLSIEPDPPPADAPFHRISQTLAHILRSRQLVLPVNGERKRAVLEQALQNPASSLPIAAVLHQPSTPLLLWITP